MVMPPRRSSSGMQSIRRELQRRRPKPLAPKCSAAKKPSVPPPRDGDREPRLLRPREEIPSSFASHSRCRAGTDAPLLPPDASPRPPAVSRSTPLCRATPSAAALLIPGTAVGVRTRTTALKTGKVLVLWLRATIVSPAHDGYKVVYDGNWPPGDPYGTVHVPLRHVRMINSSPSPTTPPPAQLPPSCAPVMEKKEMPPAPRPTRAGKKPAPHPPQPLAGDGAPGPG